MYENFHHNSAACSHTWNIFLKDFLGKIFNVSILSNKTNILALLIVHEINKEKPQMKKLIKKGKNK